LKKSGLSLERVLENMVYWKIDRTADVDR
jgi:hypothetical protein